MTEHQLQVNCFRYFRYQYPSLANLYFAIPNGMWAKNIGAAIKQKREGLMAGVFDTFLMLPKGDKHGLWVEFKIGKNKMSDNQTRFKSLAEKQQYATAVIYNFDDFKQIIDNYINES